MPLLEEVLLDILECLDRDGWDTLELVSRALKDSVRASMNSPSRVHYRRVDKVSCTGCDMLLSVEVGGKTHSFDVFHRYVFHYAFIDKFLIGSTPEKYPSIEFALALPNAVRTAVVHTLTFKELHFCHWKRNGAFCDEEPDSSVFDGLVMSFDRIDRLAFVGKDTICIVRPDYMTDDFIRRCKLKGVRQFDAILCSTDMNGDGEHDPKWSSFDISTNAIVDFLSGSVLQRLTLAFEQGRIPQRFRVAFTGQYREVRPAMREWYAACFTNEKVAPRGSADMYHIPSVDFVLYVLNDCFLIARHVDPTTHALSFASSFDF